MQLTDDAKQSYAVEERSASKEFDTLASRGESQKWALPISPCSPVCSAEMSGIKRLSQRKK
jgi:hypothetical protein